MAEASAVNWYCQKNGTQFEVSIQASPSNGFQCTLKIPGVQKVSVASASSKKGAQALAMQDMFRFLERSGLLNQTAAEPANKKRKLSGGAVSPSPAIQKAPVSPAVPKPSTAAKPAFRQAEAPRNVAPGYEPTPSGVTRHAQETVDDGAGNFTIEIARAHLNENLRRWRQPTEMQVQSQGPAHATQFRAMLNFQVRGAWFRELHVASTKKQVQNELALKVCRKLFAMGLMPPYRRNSMKSTFFESLQASKYFEAGSFGLGLQPGFKGRLRSYLQQLGYEVPDEVAAPPGTVLWEALDPESLPHGEPELSALAWSSPDAGVAPWPEPRVDPPADPYAAAVGAEASASLPIAARFQEIVDTVAQNQVSIIQGSTGSGKTTQVPQYILDFEDGGGPKTIVVTQPRRLAAMTVARRVAAERGEPLGGSVGYAIRFDSVWPQRPGGICYMTSGLLLKRLHFRGLSGISHVIVDEVHERDLDNDILLGLLRSAVSVHPELKVVLMSATIDARKFQEFMSQRPTGWVEPPPVISIDGHNYDVKVLFLEDIVEKMRWSAPPQKKEKDSSNQMNTCDAKRYSPSTVQALKAMPEQKIPLELTKDLLSALVREGTVSSETGSVLVFLPTWSIMSVLSKLVEADEVLGKSCKVIMLHSQVPKDAQMEAFRPAPAGLAKVILATNIAESSITIDDVTCVIDSCKVKLTFFSETTKLSYTDVVFTGRHNLEQRKGRAGRTRPGLCFRLCTRARFTEGLEDEVPPELTRMPLVGAALLVKSLELGEIATVLSQCPDPPSDTLVTHAISQLTLVRALDNEQNLTSLGRILARLPLDPHVGLALLMGHWFFGLGDAMATLCAAMSFDEPFHFERSAGYLPWSISQKYQGSHKHSDQFLLGLVHQEYARLLETVGENSANRFVASEGLHPAIMRQVYDASEQLRSLLQTDALGALGMGGPEPLDEDAIGPASKTRKHTAIRDWGQQEWEWGAVLLALITALPHMAVHQEKRHLWVEEDVRGAVHKGSLNCCKNTFVFPSPLFAFLDRIQEEGWRPARCRQLTNMPPLLALLKPFTNAEIRMDGEDGRCVIIAGWIPIGPVPVDTVHLVLSLRSRLEDALIECAEQISADGGAAFAKDGGIKDKELVSLLQELLRQSSLRFREPLIQARKGGKGNAGSSRPAAPQPKWSASSPQQTPRPTPTLGKASGKTAFKGINWWS